MQRLEELMQWQRQQQNKLLRHQQEQKEFITLEQKRLLKELGLVFGQGTRTTELTEMKVKADNKPESLNVGALHLNKEVMESRKAMDSFDETPVKPTKKSFNELLQEKLQIDENTENINAKEKPKKKFLKKGEGLARFRMSSNKKQLPSQKYSKKVSLPSDISKNNKVELSPCVNRSELNVNTQQSDKSTALKDNLRRHQGDTTCGFKQSQFVPNTSKLITRPARSPRCLSELDDSKQEQDELRLFELLEQQAANSSFCSNSSSVARLLGENSVKRKDASDFNNYLYQNAVLHDDISTKSQEDTRHPDAVINTNKSKKDNNAFGLSDNVRFNPFSFLGSQFSQKEQVQNEMIVGSYDSSRDKSPKPSSYDVEHSTKLKVCPRNVNINVCDSYELESSSDNSHPTNYSDNVPISSKEVQQNSEGSKGKYTSIQSTYKPVARQVDELPQACDVFRDSQAWSDCSCSSCEGSDSGNEHKPAIAIQQQHSANEKCIVNSDKDIKDSKEEPIAAQREAITFKSALLKERLTELESEIEIFKKENASLRKLKKQYESDIANFNREKKEYEKTLQENTEKMQEKISEERKKLAREKQVFEKYCKGVKSQPNRKERDEILALKQQVAELQEELIRKDTRWSASQVRMRDRMRQLNKQISQLKEENEKLKAEKAKIKKVRFVNSKGNVASNTKTIHNISEKLGQLKLETFENPIVIKNVVPRKRIPAHILSQNVTEKNLPQSIKSVQAVPALRITSEQAISVNVEEPEGAPTCMEDVCEDEIYENFHEDHNFANEEECDMNEENTSTSESLPVAPVESIPLAQNLVYNSFYPNFGKHISGQKANRKETDGNTALEELTGLPGNMTSAERDTINNYSLNENISTNSEVPNISIPKNDFVVSPSLEKNKSQIFPSAPSNKMSFTETVHGDGTREKKFSDGRQEIWYTNGNVKKQSSDKSVTKMIYYNGDVKEKYHMEGIEKYYYAETKTWQTTYSDGREILEFPNGQIEEKMPNGISKISYPNGCNLVRYADGSEEWALTDGTIVKKSSSGTKELIFPNGQKEIHTESHKRREYPDGTVKYIYPGGAQETRYATGRIRLKDKDGNLVMDSAVQ